MKKKKSLIKIIVLSFLLIAFSGMNVFATNGVKLAAEKSGENIIIKIKSVSSIVNAFQLSFKIDGDVKLKNIEWDKDISNNARINYKYNDTTNIVDIYATSNTNLVNEVGNIEIGTLIIEAEDKEEFSIIPDNTNSGSAYKFVSNTYKEVEASQMQTDGQLKFTYFKKPAIDEVPDQGDNENKPGDENTSDKVEEDETEDENILDKVEEDKIEEENTSEKVEEYKEDEASSNFGSLLSVATGSKKIFPLITLSVFALGAAMYILKSKSKKN
ncbi:MAG: hypothetical protein PUE01_05895 [Clostridiaceae bacterium]|nr:hypothetical protein [Clostridiaceae bacterium]